MVRMSTHDSEFATSNNSRSSKHILVATDGRPQSDGALIVARQLLEPADQLRLVSVVDPINLVPESVLLFSVELETERRAALQRDIANQTERVWGSPTSAELLDGDAARAIARMARESDTNLIVTGLGRHTMSDRVFGNETVLKLMRVADTPILGVVNFLEHVPRRIVVGVDFSETSLQAARFAIQLAAPGASITLVHVAPAKDALLDWAELHEKYAADALEKIRAKVGNVSDGKHLQILLEKGQPAEEILAVATRQNADLIAMGTHGHGLVARFLIGSVATKVVRSTPCSVLVFPQAAAFQIGRELRENIFARGIAPEKWTALLNDISWQNAGRTATLEIDETGLGAQVQVLNQPFFGITFDHHDSHVVIMFGNANAGGQHFTHVIDKVSSVDVLQDADGADTALRIGYDSGQAIMTFRN